MDNTISLSIKTLPNKRRNGTPCFCIIIYNTRPFYNTTIILKNRFPYSIPASTESFIERPSHYLLNTPKRDFLFLQWFHTAYNSETSGERQSIVLGCLFHTRLSYQKSLVVGTCTYICYTYTTYGIPSVYYVVGTVKAFVLYPGPFARARMRPNS